MLSKQTRMDTPGPTPLSPPPPAHRQSNWYLCFRLRVMENLATDKALTCPPVAHSSYRRRARRWVNSTLEVKTMTTVAPTAVLAVLVLYY